MSKQKHIALVVYYWPPAGGSGVQRWLFFAKAWARAGVRISVFVPKQPRVAEQDDSLVLTPHKNITVIPVSGWEPMRQNKSAIAENMVNKKGMFFGLMRWIRANLFLPDARIFWTKAVTKSVLAHDKKDPFDVLITSGPPHSLHLVGLNTNKRRQAKWVADFRDPWVGFFQNASLPMGNRAKSKHRELEQKVMATADHVVVTAPSLAKDFRQYTKRVSVLTNGYEKALNKPAKTRLGLVYAGSLKAQQNPHELWTSISELVQEHRAFAQNFRLDVYGSVASSVQDEIESFGITEYVQYNGYQSKEIIDTILPQANALLLLGVDMPNTGNIIHAKLFEYMAAARPILGIGPKPSDMEGLFGTHKLGVYASFTDKKRIKETLLSWFTKEKINFATTGTEVYERARIAADYLRLIEQLG